VFDAKPDSDFRSRPAQKAAGAAEHDDPNLSPEIQSAEIVEQFVDEFVAERVQDLGPVQRNPIDPRLTSNRKRAVNW
jgi:hypothetical protein